jgi:hypothetical protein
VDTRFARDEHFKSLSGDYFCDCSSYINSILIILDTSFYDSLKGNLRRLKASDYFDLATKSEYINSHCSIDKLIAGEVLVWKKQNIPKSGDTGHMAIVMSPPVKEREGLWRVEVSDCSKMLHDNDSRELSGVGKGEMFLITSDKKIIGYIWSSKRSKNKLCDVLCISFSKNLIE